jgi:hypothetical protein
MISPYRIQGMCVQVTPKKERKVHYLGHVISNKGVAVDPNNIKAIVDFPHPWMLLTLDPSWV